MRNNKLLIIALSLFVFLAFLTASYYFVFVPSRIEKGETEQKKTEVGKEAKIEQEKLGKEKESVVDLQGCLNAVKKEKEDVLKELIDWANSEEGKVKIKEENIDLATTYEDIVQDYHQEMYNCYNKYS